MHPKNWRPQVLSVIDTDEHGYPIKPHMLRLTAQMKKGYGVTMVLGRIIGSTLDKLAVERAGITRKILTQFMREEESHCYVDVSVSHGCMSEYIWAAALHSGLGPLRPNSILLAWPEDWKMEYNKSEQYFETLRGIINLEKTLLIFKGNDTYPGSLEKLTWATIDVWWIVYDGGLLLLLPYILSKNRVWRYGTRLRLFAVITNPSIVASEVTSAITKHLRKVRISATVTAVDFTTTSIVNDMRINRSSNVEVISNYYKSKSSRHKKSPSFSNHRTVEEVFVDLLPENLPEMKNIPKVFSETSQATDVSTNITERSEPRLETAAYFNRMVKIFSNEARLVVTNMPLIDDSTDSIEFFSYVEAMSDGIDNMLLVRGAGEEVITTYG